MKSTHAIIGLLLLTPGAAAWAGQPVCCASGDHGKPGPTATAMYSTSDLGKANPVAENLSLAPDVQVFVFTREALRYVELADASGTPRAAFTVVNGGLLTLPVGPDAVQQVISAPTWAETVFEDANVVVGRHVAVDGVVSWQVFVK